MSDVFAHYPGKKPDNVRVVFLDGTWFDFAEPTGFNFKQFVMEVRGLGMVLSDQVYVRGDLIKTIFKWNESNKPVDGQMAPGNAPTSETKQ